MKIIVLVSIIAVAMAHDFGMKFKEGGKDYVEKIKIDLAQGTEEISVPKHMDRVAVDLLKDFKVGLVARKMIAKKVCYIRSIARDDEPPKKMEMSMKLSKAKFPASRYAVVQKKYLPLVELTKEQVGEKIAAHCQGYKLIKIAVFEDEDINKYVTNMVRKHGISGKSKRDVSVQTFTACQDQSQNLVETCPQDKLAATCRFARGDGRDCVYEINCKLGNTGFKCLGTHVFNSPTCCDFVCNN